MDGSRPLSGFNDRKQALDKASGVSGWRLHDLRRTSRTLLSRAGISADHAERCLGHVIGGVRGVYDRFQYLDEKRHGFDALAALVERIVRPTGRCGASEEGAAQMKRASQHGNDNGCRTATSLSNGKRLQEAAALSVTIAVALRPA